MIAPRWRSSTVRWLLSAAGVVVVITSLAADVLAGRAETEIGGVQLLGCLAGIGAIASAVLLSPDRRPVNVLAVRWLVAIGIAACSAALTLIAPASAAGWILLGYIAAICLLLPPWFGALTFVGVLGTQWLATWISNVKADLTALPLTMLDVRIAVANPEGLWDALHLPHWTRHVAVAAACVVMFSWAWSGIAALVRFVAGAWREGIPRETVGRLVAVPVLGSLLLVHLDRIYARFDSDPSTWKPQGIARLASRVGALPFLVYSYRIESQATGDFYEKDDATAPLSREEVRDAVAQYVDFGAAGARTSKSMKPNIVVVLAESTFDPGEAFRLQGDWNRELFRPGEHSVAVGPLKVNPIGGGTWVTEFETIVGLDSRMFGYWGYYTHSSLAPFVQRSIATYLRERGYRALAFFPTQGDFYNGRRAYGSYGFQEVRDRGELTGGKGWTTNDVAIVESVKRVMGDDAAAPFFAYVLLVENHAPHDCGFTDAGRFKVRFANIPDFGPNCALHEYLRRLESTTTAVRSMMQYLADIEARTGRPFVLLTFGDHQPHTFTSTSGLERDYGAARRTQDARTTFFHFVSTTRTRLTCCSVAPPATVLPTLLSSFVAEGPDEVYLGENLWLFSRCGSDAIGTGYQGLQRLGDPSIAERSRPPEPRSDECTSAYDRALASYRHAGIIRLTNAAPARQ